MWPRTRLWHNEGKLNHRHVPCVGESGWRLEQCIPCTLRRGSGAEGAISSPGTSQALSTVQGWQLWKAARQADVLDALTEGASRSLRRPTSAKAGESLRSITERGRNPRHLHAWKVPQ